jgi:ParB family chromosome partitioning protein
LAAHNVEGYEYAESESVQADFRTQGAGLRSQIAKLLSRYGNWGGCVASFSGRVLSGATYAMACRVVGMQPRVYYVPDTKAQTVAEFFGREYGVFSYEHLPKTPSLQTFAQPYRLRNVGHPNKSTSYEKWLLPNLGREQRVLDFGCGQGDYIRFMRKQGFNAWGIEFFFRRGRSINKTQVRRFIDKAIKAIAEGGLFDHVMMDFVINSVVDKQAAHDVFVCANAFCKPGGTMYVSGRFPPAPEKAKKARGSGGIEVQFLDKDGFSGQLHFGGWFYQLYHTKESVMELLPKYFNETYKVRWAGTKWMMMAKKAVIHPLEEYEASIEREFNMPWVDGERIGKAEAMLEVWRPAHLAAIEGLEVTPFDHGE